MTIKEGGGGGGGGGICSSNYPLQLISSSVHCPWPYRISTVHITKGTNKKYGLFSFLQILFTYK